MPHDCRLEHFYAFNPISPVRCVLARKQAHEEMLFHEGRLIVAGHIRDLKVKHMGVGVYELTLVPRPVDQEEE